jgi:hypothetical protein
VAVVVAAAAALLAPPEPLVEPVNSVPVQYSRQAAAVLVLSVAHLERAGQSVARGRLSIVLSAVKGKDKHNMQHQQVLSELEAWAAVLRAGVRVVAQVRLDIMQQQIQVVVALGVLQARLLLLILVLVVDREQRSLLCSIARRRLTAILWERADQAGRLALAALPLATAAVASSS